MNIVAPKDYDARTPSPHAKAEGSETAEEAVALVTRLANLLGAPTLDLTSIGEEIRAVPDLQLLVMRLAESLSLSPDDCVMNLEDAAVVLGAERLRVLVYMWSTFAYDSGTIDYRQTHNGTEFDCANDPLTRVPVAHWTPETLYLASFLRWLGLDSPTFSAGHDQPPCTAFGLQNAEFSELRHLLMRDFMALIPMLKAPDLKA